MQLLGLRCNAIEHQVSILTQPEGWVQPTTRQVASAIPGVSILTQPEGWVQPTTANTMGFRPVFQSSPSPKAGCNFPLIDNLDCNKKVSILTQPEGWVQPNGVDAPNAWTRFQSSPSPKAGCNASSIRARSHQHFKAQIREPLLWTISRPATQKQKASKLKNEALGGLARASPEIHLRFGFARIKI